MGRLVGFGFDFVLDFGFVWGWGGVGWVWWCCWGFCFGVSVLCCASWFGSGGFLFEFRGVVLVD